MITIAKAISQDSEQECVRSDGDINRKQSVNNECMQEIRIRNDHKRQEVIMPNKSLSWEKENGDASRLRITNIYMSKDICRDQKGT